MEKAHALIHRPFWMLLFVSTPKTSHLQKHLRARPLLTISIRNSNFEADLLEI